MKALDVLTNVRESLAAKVIAVIVAMMLVMSCFTISGLAFATQDDYDVSGSSSTSTSGSLGLPGAKDAVSTAVHAYYTNGTKDGETREDITGKKVDDIIRDTDITQVYEYSNEKYEFADFYTESGDSFPTDDKKLDMPYSLKTGDNFIYLVYGRTVYTTNDKPGTPSPKEVYDLTDNVVVTCKPGKHTVGRFDCIINDKGANHTDRITIGAVEGNDQAGYTCTVTFLAEKYADAYSKLKSETHTPITGDTAVTFKWNANANGGEWEALNLTGPITFTVTCEKPQTYTVTYADGVGGVVFANQDKEGLIDGVDTPPFVDDENNVTEPVREGYIFTGWTPVVSEKVNSNAIYTAQWVPELTDQTVNRLVRGEKTDTSATVIVSCAPGHHAVARFDCYDEATEGDGINIHPGRIIYDTAQVNEDGSVTQDVIFLYAEYLKAYGSLKKYDHVRVVDQDNQTINFIYKDGQWSRNDDSTSPVEFVVACDHDYEAAVTASDCINPEVTTYTCKFKNCKAQYSSETGLPTGHNFENVEFVDYCENHDDEDCIGHVKLCKNCNGKLDGGKSEEKHVFGEWKVTKDATIYEDGVQECECAVCGHKVTDTISKLVSITVTWKDGYTDTTDNPTADVLEQKKYEKADEQIVPEGDFPTVLEREGYNFTGWSEPVRDDNDNITYTAQWAVTPNAPGDDEPEAPTPGPGDNPSDPTPGPGTDEPTEPTEPTTPDTPGTTPVATTPGTVAPTAGPAAAPAAAAPAAAPAATATIDDNANPLGDLEAGEESIADDENPLGAFDLPHCWVHWLMIIGMALTAIYGAVVLIRRKRFTDDNNKFEKSVLGEDKETEKVYAPLGSQQAI